MVLHVGPPNQSLERTHQTVIKFARRCKAFSGITTGPEPGTGMLLLAALIGLGVSCWGPRASRRGQGLAHAV